MRGGRVECVVIILHMVEMGGGGTFWGEFEKIKALFVLRGIGEWVQVVAAAVTQRQTVGALMELMVV